MTVSEGNMLSVATALAVPLVVAAPEAVPIEPVLVTVGLSPADPE